MSFVQDSARSLRSSRLQTLQTLLSTYDFEGKTLLKEGVLTHITRYGAAKCQVFFLFSDCLMYATPVSASKLKFKDEIRLSALTVEPTAKGFVLSHGRKSIELRTAPTDTSLARPGLVLSPFRHWPTGAASERAEVWCDAIEAAKQERKKTAFSGRMLLANALADGEKWGGFESAVLDLGDTFERPASAHFKTNTFT